MDSKIDLSKYSVVLLSAGIGRRMGKLGKIKSKSLLKINSNQTLISRIINLLKKRKVKRVNLIVGYKSNLIKKDLKKIKNLDFKFIKIKNFKSNGHAYSWYSFKKEWFKNMKPLLILHTDILFNSKYLDNILKSKKKNIIGVKWRKNHKLKRDSYIVKSDKNSKILSIERLKNNKNFYGEVIGINKISLRSSRKIFNYMKNFFNKETKKYSWEEFLNLYIKNTTDQFYLLKKQNYNWVNINTIKDYFIAKNCKFNS